MTAVLSNPVTDGRRPSHKGFWMGGGHADTAAGLDALELSAALSWAVLC
jgi:hypothetical protein